MKADRKACRRRASHLHSKASLSMKKLISWVLMLLVASTVSAQSAEGTWVFDKTVDYEGVSTALAAPFTTRIDVAGSQASLSPNCTVGLSQRAYYPGGPFQLLLKSGQDDPAIGAFLSRQFAFRLSDTKVFYVAEAGLLCNKLGSHYLVTDDRLIAIRGGSLFYAFKRDKSAAVTAAPTSVELSGLKISRLPFSVETYNNTCLANTPKRKGVPQANQKCGSVVTPYVVSRDSKEPLLKAVGAHAFTKGGARGASDDYDNPIVLVFPPLKGVVLVRVDDLEGGDARNTMSGAYLAIKDGKVTAQLNEGCGFDSEYVCSTPGESARFRLLDTGKFVLVK